MSNSNRSWFGPIVIIAMVVVGVFAFGKLYDIDLPFGTETKDHSPPVMVNQIRDLAEFRAAEADIADRVNDAFRFPRATPRTRRHCHVRGEESRWWPSRTVHSRRPARALTGTGDPESAAARDDGFPGDPGPGRAASRGGHFPYALVEAADDTRSAG